MYVKQNSSAGTRLRELMII